VSTKPVFERIIEDLAHATRPGDGVESQYETEIIDSGSILL
jgi:hypothetical protein